MATDDKSKKRKADAPKKKKRAPEPAEGADARAAGARPAGHDDDARLAAKRAATDDDAPPSAPEPAGDVPEGALVVRGGESIRLSDDGEPLPAGAEHAAARAGDEELFEDAPATQLGVERYVMAAFFTAGLVGSYVLGKALHSVWSSLSNRAFFTSAVPSLAAISDESKATIAMVFAGIVGLVVVFKAYRRPDVHGWADDVAS